MFYILLKNGLPTEISDKYPSAAGEIHSRDGKNGWISSRDFEAREQADAMAKYLTAMTGKIHLGVDEGEGVSPRYRVIEAPQIGDFVSRSFNGDSYPVGTIVKITPTWIVKTDSGKTFRRWKETGGWREQGRGFWMVKGYHEEKNPHF